MIRKIFILAGVSALTVVGFLGFERLHPDAPVSGKVFDPALGMTPEVQRIVGAACADCHSQGTRTRWYASVPPASWLVESDVRKARAAMNLSKWTKQSGKTPALAIGTLAAACAVVEAGQMPPAQYKLVHSDASLTSEDQKTFCDWTHQQIAHVVASKRTMNVSVPAAISIVGKSKKMRLLH